MTPRCRALARAAQMAAETASRSRDAALEAEKLREMLKAELSASRQHHRSEQGAAIELGAGEIKTVRATRLLDHQGQAKPSNDLCQERVSPPTWQPCSRVQFRKP
jgi:hypothetical protein